MILYLKDRDGSIITQNIKKMSLKKAKKKYNSKLFKVIKVENETKGYLSNKEALRIIQNEGICYAVNSYADDKDFKKRKTRLLWKNLSLAIHNLQKHLEKDLPF